MERKINHRDDDNVQDIDVDGYGWGECNTEDHGKMLDMAHEERGHARNGQGAGEQEGVTMFRTPTADDEADNFVLLGADGVLMGTTNARNFEAVRPAPCAQMDNDGVGSSCSDVGPLDNLEQGLSARRSCIGDAGMREKSSGTAGQ